MGVMCLIIHMKKVKSMRKRSLKSDLRFVNCFLNLVFAKKVIASKGQDKCFFWKYYTVYVYFIVKLPIYMNIYLYLAFMCYRLLKMIFSRSKYGRRGIAPIQDCTHFFKGLLNLFECIKPNFFS